jgi:hypothetical protein
MAYFISINGAAKVTMQSLNLTFRALDLHNMQTDVAALNWTRKTISEWCPLVHNDTVEIFLETRRLFRGRARLGIINWQGADIRIDGPWSHLEEQDYQLSLISNGSSDYGTPEGPRLGDTFVVVLTAGTTVWTATGSFVLPGDFSITFTVGNRSLWFHPSTNGEWDVNTSWSSRGWLFRPLGTAGQIYTTIQDEFTRLMTFMSHTSAPDLYTVGTVSLGALLAPKVRTISDTKLAQCIRQVLSAKPDASVWWDYSGSDVPVLNAGVASLEVAIALTIGNNEGQVLTDYSLKIADDLVPSGVVIRWERDASTSTGLGTPFLTDIYPGLEVIRSCSLTLASTTAVCASTAHLSAGMLVTGTGIRESTTIASITNATTFVLSVAATATGSGLTLLAKGTTGVASYEPNVLINTVDEELPVAPGIAKEIYTSLAVRRAQGTLTVLDRDLSLGLRPGTVITLSGDPHFDSVQLWVQSVSWSPDTGFARLTVGYPAHLNLRDRVDLKGWFKYTFVGPHWTTTQIVPPP